MMTYRQGERKENKTEKAGTLTSNKNFGKEDKTAKPVWQWTESGRKLAAYQSCYAAAMLTGCNAIGIARAAKGRYYSTGGYRWTWAGVPLVVEENPHRYKGKAPKLKSCKPVTLAPIGNPNETTFYPSITEAARAVGVRSDNRAVIDCLHGKRESAHGYQWKFAI